MPPKKDNPASTSDSKLDSILEQLKALDQLGPMNKNISDLVSSMGEIKEEIKSLSYTVDTHEDRIQALEKDMAQQRELSNTQQQQLRSLTVRFLNIPYSSGEADNNSANLKDLIYGRFLYPLLLAAAKSNEIPTIPSPGEIIESCFRPYSPEKDKPPPPVILNLANKQAKIAIMMNKKELPKPTKQETDAGISRFILIEDLTPDTHRALSALSKSKLSHKVWSVDGRIKFTTVAKPDVVQTVKSVYDPIAKILSE